MDSLTKKAQFERSKINLHAPDELRCWAHKLGITREDLRKAVEKVGNSAAAVRKELKKQRDELAAEYARGPTAGCTSAVRCRLKDQ